MFKKLSYVVPGFVSLVALAFLILGLGTAQEKTAPEEYQAEAMGQGDQMGQMFNVTIHIDQYSTPEERQLLIDAFEKAGSPGLSNALAKMKSKGNIAMTGTTGYDISFARKLPGPNGTKIRVLTNRPITFGGAWTDNRSNYALSAIELDLTSEKNKSTGALLPACQFSIDPKTKELEVQPFQNPWKLVDVRNRDQ